MQRQINASKTLILVIEDDPALRESLSELLHLNQFTVIGVATGAAGIAQAGEQAPHCILCDLSLPDIDGFVVLRQLKSNSQTQHIPVIVLSGYAEPANQELAIHLGATGYVTKPYEFQDLLGIINRVIQRGS